MVYAFGANPQGEVGCQVKDKLVFEFISDKPFLKRIQRHAYRLYTAQGEGGEIRLRKFSQAANIIENLVEDRRGVVMPDTPFSPPVRTVLSRRGNVKTLPKGFKGRVTMKIYVVIGIHYVLYACSFPERRFAYGNAGLFICREHLPGSPVYGWVPL